MEEQRKESNSEYVARVLDAADIVEVIGQYVELTKRGDNYTGVCPFHKTRKWCFFKRPETKPTFVVSPKYGIYKCFRCGKSGSVINFLMEHNLWTFKQAVKYLEIKYRVTSD